MKTSKAESARCARIMDENLSAVQSASLQLQIMMEVDEYRVFYPKAVPWDFPGPDQVCDELLLVWQERSHEEISRPDAAPQRRSMSHIYGDEEMVPSMEQFSLAPLAISEPDRFGHSHDLAVRPPASALPSHLRSVLSSRDSNQKGMCYASAEGSAHAGFDQVLKRNETIVPSHKRKRQILLSHDEDDASNRRLPLKAPKVVVNPASPVRGQESGVVTRNSHSHLGTSGTAFLKPEVARSLQFALPTAPRSNAGNMHRGRLPATGSGYMPYGSSSGKLSARPSPVMDASSRRSWSPAPPYPFARAPSHNAIDKIAVLLADASIFLPAPFEPPPRQLRIEAGELAATLSSQQYESNAPLDMSFGMKHQDIEPIADHRQRHRRRAQQQHNRNSSNSSNISTTMKPRCPKNPSKSLWCHGCNENRPHLCQLKMALEYQGATNHGLADNHESSSDDESGVSDVDMDEDRYHHSSSPAADASEDDSEEEWPDSPLRTSHLPYYKPDLSTNISSHFAKRNTLTAEVDVQNLHFFIKVPNDLKALDASNSGYERIISVPAEPLARLRMIRFVLPPINNSFGGDRSREVRSHMQGQHDLRDERSFQRDWILLEIVDRVGDEVGSTAPVSLATSSLANRSEYNRQKVRAHNRPFFHLVFPTQSITSITTTQSPDSAHSPIFSPSDPASSRTKPPRTSQRMHMVLGKAGKLPLVHTRVYAEDTLDMWIAAAGRGEAGLEIVTGTSSVSTPGASTTGASGAANGGGATNIADASKKKSGIEDVLSGLSIVHVG